VGSRARLKQPKLPPATWKVTELRPGSSFTWVSASPLVTMTGGHHLVPEPDGTVKVVLTIDFTGPLAVPLGLLTSNRTRSYVNMEAAGLKRHTEGG
jgi:hypothetical protein